MNLRKWWERRKYWQKGALLSIPFVFLLAPFNFATEFPNLLAIPIVNSEWFYLMCKNSGEYGCFLYAMPVILFFYILEVIFVGALIGYGYGVYIKRKTTKKLAT